MAYGYTATSYQQGNSYERQGETLAYWWNLSETAAKY